MTGVVIVNFKQFTHYFAVLIADFYKVNASLVDPKILVLAIKNISQAKALPYHGQYLLEHINETVSIAL